MKMQMVNSSQIRELRLKIFKILHRLNLMKLGQTVRNAKYKKIETKQMK